LEACARCQIDSCTRSKSLLQKQSTALSASASASSFMVRLGTKFHHFAKWSRATPYHTCTRKRPSRTNQGRCQKMQGSPWSPCCNGRVVVAVTLVLVVVGVLVVETMILFRACRHYCLSRGGAVSKCRLLFVIVKIVHRSRGRILRPSMLTDRLPTSRDKKLGAGTRRRIRLRQAISTGPAAPGACASTWRDKRTMGRPRC
jgi:hypothetical protein